MVYSPSTTLLSSGRKEYSATKITSYFSPKPSPVASPQISAQAQAQAQVQVEDRIGDNKVQKVEADMPVETRKRAAQPRTASEVRTNGVQQPETPTPAVPPPARTVAEPKANGAGTPAKSNKNVDKVIFGDLLFDCSYTSRHVRELVGDKVAEGKEMLDRLCVCPHCFKYTAEIVKYLGHIKVCPRRKGGSEAMVPGKKVYKHGGGWEVWEVDGEDDQLYCQNLSLFAKLFLGDKSVSFDVSSFIYYLLVHRDSDRDTCQAIGFFSKEKQSWDLNNLACILIFSPWQRKGLGSILMGLSYAISRHEGLIGGPEKPLSELGMRGYVSFWSGKIARWLLSEARDKTSLEDISKGTWILKEDCLEALRSMGVLDERKDGEGNREVTIDLKRVKEWVGRTGTSLLPTVDKDGWLDDFYCREKPEENEDEEMEE